MIRSIKKTLLFITCFVLAAYGYAQANAITVTFIGNCALHMSDGEMDLYLDFPYKSGAYGYMEYDQAQLDRIADGAIFIFTHRHADHYSKKLLKRTNGQKFDPKNVSELEKLNGSLPNFEIQAFRTSHKVFGISFKHYSYLITWHGKKIYISGDTGDLEDVRGLKDIDRAFVNPWLFMNAQNENVIIDATNFGLYHLYPDQKIDGTLPGNLVVLKDQGKTITIDL